jgi:hypothetical protein
MDNQNFGNLKEAPTFSRGASLKMKYQIFYEQKNNFFYVITFFILLLLFLTVVEITGRIYYSQYIIRTDEEIDHRLTPNTKETNADGIRSEKESLDFKHNDLNIIFLGDSFTYGERVQPQSAFPQQFEDIARIRHPELNINVANFGWVSSSPYLSLRLLKDIGLKYSPDIVVLCIDMTDFHDDIKYENLILKPKLIYKVNWYFPGFVAVIKHIFIASSKNQSLKYLDKLQEIIFGLPSDRFFMVNMPLKETRKLAGHLIANLNNIHKYVKNDLNARFIVIVLPRNFQYSKRESPDNWEKHKYTVFGPYVYEPFKLFGELSKSVSYPIYSLLEVFQNERLYPTCFIDDPHWNENGHKIAAQEIYEIMKRENILK